MLRYKFHTFRYFITYSASYMHIKPVFAWSAVNYPTECQSFVSNIQMYTSDGSDDEQMKYLRSKYRTKL